MPQLSRTELLLLVSPLLILPAIVVMRQFNAPNTPPTPTPPKPVAKLPLNIYSNEYLDYESILASPDGKFIHTGTVFKKIKIATWNARTGELVRNFGIFRYGNTDMVLSPNSKTLAFGYGGWNGDRFVLFDAATGKEKLQIQKPKTTQSHGFDISNDLVALPSDDDMQLYSVKTGSRVTKLTHRRNDFYPRNPRFSRDGKKLLWIGGSNNEFESYANGNSTDEIVCFDLKTKRKLQTYSSPRMQFMQARFSGDGKVVLAYGFQCDWKKKAKGLNSVDLEKRLFAFDAHSGQQIFAKRLNNIPNDFATSPDGKWFSFHGQQATDPADESGVTICEVRTGKEVITMGGRSTNCGSWSSDSKTLYFADRQLRRVKLGNDGKWKLLKWRSKEDLARLQYRNQPPD